MITNETSAVIEKIRAERIRQVDEEGWTPEHDDRHRYGEMASAAAAYADHGAKPDEGRQYMPGAPIGWPWSFKWWKPTTPRRDLIKAAALIVAEIERLDREAAKAGGR